MFETLKHLDLLFVSARPGAPYLVQIAGLGF
jgi:hypothetical protein